MIFPVRLGVLSVVTLCTARMVASAQNQPTPDHGSAPHVKNTGAAPPTGEHITGLDDLLQIGVIGGTHMFNHMFGEKIYPRKEKKPDPAEEARRKFNLPEHVTEKDHIPPSKKAEGHDPKNASDSKEESDSKAESNSTEESDSKEEESDEEESDSEDDPDDKEVHSSPLQKRNLRFDYEFDECRACFCAYRWDKFAGRKSALARRAPSAEALDVAAPTEASSLSKKSNGGLKKRELRMLMVTVAASFAEAHEHQTAPHSHRAYGARFNHCKASCSASQVWVAEMFGDRSYCKGV